MTHRFAEADTLIVSIVVLYVGTVLTRKLGLLERYNIPPAVTGGLLCSVVVALMFVVWDLQITFDMRLRDLLLLVFFSTIGLSAKMRLLLEGGRALALLLAVAAGFLLIQNSTGVLRRWASTRTPGRDCLPAASPSPAATAPPSRGATRPRKRVSTARSGWGSPLPPSASSPAGSSADPSQRD